MTDLVGVLTQNFVALVALVATVAVVAILASAFLRMHSNRYRTKMAELMMEQSKLEMVHRRELLREYSNAAVVLNDDEKARIDAINEDLATLSRRAVALMSEVDARTSRLERGVEIAKMTSHLDKIRKDESRLFALKG